MKVVLVLFVVAAGVYSKEQEIPNRMIQPRYGLADMFTIENCVGIRHDPSRYDDNGKWIIEKATSFEICCDWGFTPDTIFEGFDYHMRVEEIRSVVHNNYITISEVRKNCHEQPSPLRISRPIFGLSTMFTIENCIGILHDPSRYDDAGGWKREKPTSYEVCCDWGFTPIDVFEGFDNHMKVEDIPKVVHDNFLVIIKYRRNCIERKSPPRIIPPPKVILDE